jgi:hypothetical protein
MKPANLILRCYAEKLDDTPQWQAFCLDLNLAAQGDSLEDVKYRLEAMICGYVEEAVIGEDKEFAYQLLNRKAPLLFWVKYYLIVLQNRLGQVQDSVKSVFIETLPLTPNCHP